MRRGREDGPGLELRPCPLHLYGGYQYPTHAPSLPSFLPLPSYNIIQTASFHGPKQEDFLKKRKTKRGKLEQ